MESSAMVWEVLARSGREVVTTRDLSELAERLGHKPAHVVRHLRRGGYLLPLFRGYYYVRTPEELRFKNGRRNHLELFALAAEAKGIGAWYFGLTTALRLNGMTHEDRREEDVISDRFYRIRGIPIGTRRFVIRKWTAEMTTFGLVGKGPYRYSTPEKTVLDLAYKDHWNRKKGHPETRVWVEHIGSVDPSLLREHLSHYPREVARLVEEAL